MFSGVAAPFGRRAGRALTVLFVGLALFHLAFGWRTRELALRGERDAAGTIIDDRTVVLEYRGLAKE